MNQYTNDCDAFELTLEELEQISCEEDLTPRAPSELPELSFKTYDNHSFGQWQKTYLEIFPWSDHTLLKNVNPGSIIMTNVALPCVVSIVMKDFSDPVFLKKLKSKGLIIVQLQFGQTHFEVSFSYILCLLLTYTYSHYTNNKKTILSSSKLS